MAPGRRDRASIVWGAALVALATGLRLAWVLAVPTVPVSDFAMYRESANYLSEFGVLDPGFIYMPGFVALLAWVKDAGGDLLAEKLLGVAFGGLGAAGLFALTRALVDARTGEGGARTGEGGARTGEGGARTGEGVPPSRWRRICPCPYAVTATLILPFGRRASPCPGRGDGRARRGVAGRRAGAARDPGAAPSRRRGAGVRSTMGLAAWVRAVALPLSALAFVYWLARRERLHRAALLAALGLSATLLVLLPWGIRHVRQSGELYFTDDHGGITALIGANPDSEGTYTRALNSLFKDVTGRSVLDEPHRQTDRAAYAMAREWLRFEPGYALGLAADKADRLFDPEHRLLYWPIFRPGVLVGRPAAFFARAPGRVRRARRRVRARRRRARARRHRDRRRAPALAACSALLPFQLALSATYVDLLRGAALPAADRDARVPVRGAGPRRDCGRRRRGGGARAGRDRPAPPAVSASRSWSSSSAGG